MYDIELLAEAGTDSFGLVRAMNENDARADAYSGPDDEAAPETCSQCQEDGYCSTCNPLGGDYSAIRAEMAAEPPKEHRTTRREAQWGTRRGSGGWGNRRRG